MLFIARAMAAQDSGLEVKDRMWLKIIIPSAFLGTISFFYVQVNNENTKQVITFEFVTNRFGSSRLVIQSSSRICGSQRSKKVFGSHVETELH
jgi:hypothetical protein